MINLKLAEYNKDGKCERFLEVGKDFLFGEEVLFLPYGDYSNRKNVSYGVSPKPDAIYFAPVRICYRDQKDPLNRFDGKFDGRTYGDGRFVLIENDCDHVQGFGNLHENPELWKKIKSK